MPYVVAGDIIDMSQVESPTAADVAWSEACADAIEGYIAGRLNGFTPTADETAELERAALLDGMAAYAERKAPHGIMSFGAEGDIARLGRDISRALEPVIFRITGPGIG